MQLARPKLHYAFVTWNPSITSTDDNKLERIQRKYANISLFIIIFSPRVL